jgi:hypothetical protein
VRTWKETDVVGEYELEPEGGRKLFVSLVGGSLGFNVGHGHFLVRRDGWIYSSDGKYAVPESSVVQIVEA